MQNLAEATKYINEDNTNEDCDIIKPVKITSPGIKLR